MFCNLHSVVADEVFAANPACVGLLAGVEPFMDNHNGLGGSPVVAEPT